MIIGNPDSFAVESSIHVAYSDHEGLAWGCFTYHIGGLRYGVTDLDATMMRCSLDQVTDRLAARGTHAAGPLAIREAGAVWDAYRELFYGMEDKILYAGLGYDEYQWFYAGNDLVLAPDGDEAFDDGSHVLQFDIGPQVRLIAARSGSGLTHDPSTLRDVRLPADEFYRVLAEWRRAYLEEWEKSPKSPRPA